MQVGGFCAKSIFILANYVDGGAVGRLSTLERSDYSPFLLFLAFVPV